MVFLTQWPLWAHAKHWVFACVDCYSSASLYATEIKHCLAPGDTVEWILVKTHDRHASHEATLRAFPPESLRLEWPDGDPATKRPVLDTLKAKKIDHVFGGMDEGQYFASELNADLGFRDNPVTSRDLRRKKLDMSLAVGDYGIPTHDFQDIPSALLFVDSFPQEEVTIKFNAGAGAVGLEFVSKKDRAHLIQKLTERLHGDRTGFTQKEDDLVLQPRILGREFFADTFTWNGKTYLTGLWEYYKVQLGPYLIYFVDRALELDSEIAQEIVPIVSEINNDLELINGPGHIELFRENTTGRWYLVENNARVVGGGIPSAEKKIWGISHLELYLLSIVDPKRLEKELATFPRKKKLDAANLIVPTPIYGSLNPDAMRSLRQLGTRISYGAQFDPADRKPVKPTHNLMTSAFMVTFAGGTEAIRADLDSALGLLTSGRLIDPAPVPTGCAASIVAESILFDSLRSRLQTVVW
ncbi:MAG: ATP-grasp domain-containing protein [Bdellovibrionales bacterium]|nr:ATP-grasp domain-containing protein [Bdellovibrionales bacterium]